MNENKNEFIKTTVKIKEKIFDIKTMIRVGNCPKCGAKCNYKNYTSELIYIWCTECKYQTFEARSLYWVSTIDYNAHLV
ncbi:MAG: hypothetical protein V3V33_12490 [Candidatus Lokiarchaeia archaeon]